MASNLTSSSGSPPPTKDSSNSNYFSTLSTAEVQRLLDEQIESLSKPWKGTLPFPVHIATEKDHVSTSFFDKPPVVVDICAYLNGAGHPAIKLYFCPKKYPPPTSSAEMKGKSASSEHSSWCSLKRDLCVAAHESGNLISANGGGQYRKFVCAGSRQRQRKSMCVTTKTPYRGTTLVNNDKGNRRNDGKKMPRKIKTKDQTQKCPFTFTVSWDSFGFHVVLSRYSGNPCHSFHPKPIADIPTHIPVRFLTDQQKESTRSVMTSGSNKALGRNYLFTTTGKYLNNVKLAYLDRKEKAKDGSKGSETMDDIEKMLDNFENSQEISFTTLSDMPLADLHHEQPTESLESITVSTTKNGKGSLVNTPVQDIPTLAPIAEMAKTERVRRKMSAAQYLFISIAWIVLPVFRFFKLCPEVLWCDITSHSNNKGFHLLTFSCRTSVDRQVIFMYIWIPNEQRISFRWCFQHALPILIPKFLRDRVRFIMKDGDPQQRNEIIYALVSVFPNAIEGGCGWHIGKN